MSYAELLGHIQAVTRMHLPENVKDLIPERLPRNCEGTEQ